MEPVLKVQWELFDTGHKRESFLLENAVSCRPFYNTIANFACYIALFEGTFDSEYIKFSERYWFFDQCDFSLYQKDSILFKVVCISIILIFEKYKYHIFSLNVRLLRKLNANEYVCSYYVFINISFLKCFACFIRFFVLLQ